MHYIYTLYIYMHYIYTLYIYICTIYIYTIYIYICMKPVCSKIKLRIHRKEWEVNYGKKLPQLFSKFSRTSIFCGDLIMAIPKEFFAETCTTTSLTYNQCIVYKFTKSWVDCSSSLQYNSERPPNEHWQVYDI